MKIVADRACIGLKEAVADQAELLLLNAADINAQTLVGADALICRSTVKINEALLDNTSLRFIGSCVSGVDHVDFKAIKKHGIAFADAKGCNAVAVRDYVLSALAQLDLLKPLKKIAVIGHGQIGSRLAKVLNQLGLDVLICDPLAEGIAHVPLDNIAGVDAITFHVPLTKNGPYPTYEMIHQAFLNRQKAGCVLINTARAEIIRESDLLKFAKSHRVVLDVWHGEPNINPQMLELAYFATPHIAGHTVEGKLRGTAIIYEQLCQLYRFHPYDFHLQQAVKSQLSVFYQLIDFTAYRKMIYEQGFIQARKAFIPRSDVLIHL